MRLKYASRKGDEAELIKPKLYAVVIGVSDYVEPGLRLGYVAADARGVAEALQQQKGGLYRDVEVRPLVDRDATRTAVLEALEWLDAQVTSRDVGVMIAGHGYTDEKGRQGDRVPRHLSRQRREDAHHADDMLLSPPQSI